MARSWKNVIPVLAAAAVAGCSGETPAPEPQPDPAPKAEPAPEAPKEAKRPDGPMPGIIMVQAQFITKGGKPKPGPAKMVLYQTDGKNWYDTVIEDPDSNVFHKGMWWNGGILTIGAMKAKLKHWKPTKDGWKAEEIWEQSWGGKFDRLRDIEIGDLDGDGADELAIATHDMGVVAVGDEKDGKWTFAEYDKEADIFVHEVEIGDVDGDGKKEFYVTPSQRNKASGVSQPGGVARYDFKGGKYVRSEVVAWDESHAKEILVTDLDGDGKDELYVVREGHVEKVDGKKKLKDPVTILQMMPGKGGKWKEVEVAKLDGDPQTRFLTSGDIDGDGKKDLLAAGMDTGLWMLSKTADGFKNTLIDKNSGGFEHASHLADLDGDGKLEVYVAADKQQEFRQYVYNGKGFDKTKIADIPKLHITWNLQDFKH